jgi:uncharacterized DUF497 family protein
MAVQKSTLNKGVTAESRMQVAGFDWDEGNRSKCQKHGVSPAAIEDISQGNRRSSAALEIRGALQGNRQDW